MSEEKKNGPKPEAIDEELSNLLDSALEDFKKDDSASKPAESSKTGQEVSTTEPTAQEWSTDFIKETASKFEDNFASLLGDSNAQLTPEFLQQKLQQMADAAQFVLEHPEEPQANSTNFASSISETIQNLNAGVEELKAPMSEEDLMKLFSGAGGQGSDNEFLPFMQGMMQGLLSKEVLGPSLQDFIEKLPDYIEKNKATLPKEDIERYEKQKALMEEVLEELNKEKDTDSVDVKKDRFSKVLALMQKLQEYGQPPAEIVGDVEAPFNFDPMGNPVNFPGLPANPDGANQECNVM